MINRLQLALEKRKLAGFNLFPRRFVKVRPKYIICIVMALNTMHHLTLRMLCNRPFDDLVKIEETRYPRKMSVESDCRMVNETKNPPVTNSTITEYKKWLINDIYIYAQLLIFIPMGVLSDIFGARNIVIVQSVMGIVLSYVYIPIINGGSWIGLTIHFIFLGICESTVCVGSMCLVSHWVPEHEQTIFLAVCWCGFDLASMYTGSLIHYLFHYWEMMYIFVGSSYAVLLILNICFIHSSPFTSPYASPKDKADILKEIEDELPEVIPWRNILLDGSIWALVAGQTAGRMVIEFVNTYSTDFVVYVIGIDYNSYTYMIFVTALCAATTRIVSSFLAQYCINRKFMPVLYVRTLANGIGNISPFIMVILATYNGCYPGGILASYTLAISMKSIGEVGTLTNVLDKTRYYCGTAVALVDGFGAVTAGLGLNKMIYYFRTATINDWRMILSSFTSITTFLAILYYVWSVDSRAPWDHTHYEVELLERRLHKEKTGKRQSAMSINM